MYGYITKSAVSTNLVRTAWAILVLSIVGWIGIHTKWEHNQQETQSEAHLIGRNAFPNLSFDNPVEFVQTGDNSARFFVVEQAGIIKVFSSNSSTSSSFLDISSRVRFGGEQGLLGLAFHPDFSKNGFFYVNYTAARPLRTIVSRFSISKTNPDQADADSEKVLLSFEQPYSNHNGGKIAFGPDGYLYIATGDGGSTGDPQNHSQNKSSLLGKMLRIDVNKTEGGNPYAIPADNPFVSESTTRPEIYAYGLRNPWRFSFDKSSGKLWVGDVGQNELEEVDIIEKGGNYGWRIKEADKCYQSRSNCIEKDLIKPVYQYSHSNGDISVTGGYVYRGNKLPDLQGKYIYADYASGRVWALTYEEGKPVQNKLLFKLSGTVSAFGEDAQHELYICDYANGKILSLTDMRK